MPDTVKVFISLKSPNSAELKRVLDYNAERIIAIDSNTDIITSVSSVDAYADNDKDDRTKLQLLSSIIDDIMAHGKPSEEDLDYDDDAMLVYDNIEELRESLENMGY